MEVKINREIRNYTESIFFGLSMRQFIFSCVGILGAILVYFLFKDKLGLELTSWICILTVAPCALLGFVKYNGMNLEEVVIAFIKGEILTPRKLVFESNNIYYEITKDYYEKLKKEELKRDKIFKKYHKQRKRKDKDSKEC